MRAIRLQRATGSPHLAQRRGLGANLVVTSYPIGKWTNEHELAATPRAPLKVGIPTPSENQLELSTLGLAESVAAYAVSSTQSGRRWRSRIDAASADDLQYGCHLLLPARHRAAADQAGEYAAGLHDPQLPPLSLL